MESPLWSVVLAAGAGQRLSEVTGGTPKQFWRPTGAKSLVENTLARLAPICPVDRTVIVVNESQRDHVRRWPGAHQSGRIVFQPDDRGTAAGVLFGLLPVLTTDPAAVVVVTPADHGVENPEAFLRGIRDAVEHVRRHDRVVLFGVEPTAAHADYGWISLGSAQRVNTIQPVMSFIEKPSIDIARQRFSTGAVWNTLVIVAQARALLDLCRERLPVVGPVFVAALTMPPTTREAFLGARYPQLPSRDLSRHVLMPSRNLAAYTWPASIGWSDLGTPERLEHWVRRAQPKRHGTTWAMKASLATGATATAL